MKLIDYLKNRGIYNISALERAAGMPARTLHNAVNGQRELPGTWVYPLMLALGEIKIDGWLYTADTERRGYFARKFDDKRKVNSEVIQSGTGGLCLEYYVPELREYYDEFDFFQIIS